MVLNNGQCKDIWMFIYLFIYAHKCTHISVYTGWREIIWTHIIHYNFNANENITTKLQNKYEYTISFNIFTNFHNCYLQP